MAVRTGLREHEALSAAFRPASKTITADDHKAYYTGAERITIRITGDRGGRLLGAQLVGGVGSQTAKRVDTYATVLFHEMAVDQISDLDLSYTPPFGSPWDAVQLAAQAWMHEHRSSVGGPTVNTSPGESDSGRHGPEAGGTAPNEG